MKIDYIEFESIIKGMKDGSKAFHIVRDELRARGRWKNAPRGRAFTAVNGSFYDVKAPTTVAAPKSAKNTAEIVSENDFIGW